MGRIWDIIKDYGGVGIGCAVFAVFLVLKVTGIVGWSWWIVVAPLWVPLAIDFLLSAVYVICQVYMHRKIEKEE